MLKLKQRSRRWLNNGKPKERTLINKLLKTQSTEQLLEPSIQPNSKEWMRLSPFGFVKNQTSKSNNTNSSTRMSLEIVVILTPGHTSKLKETLILLDLSLFQKEHPMTNSTNSMRKNQKLNSMSEEYWSMISSKTFSPSTWTSSRPSLTQIIFPLMWTEKTCNTIKH